MFSNCKFLDNKGGDDLLKAMQNLMVISIPLVMIIQSCSGGPQFGGPVYSDTGNDHDTTGGILNGLQDFLRFLSTTKW